MNANDIQNTFAAKTKTFGSGSVYRCQVFIGGAFVCEGLGSSIESAEDTAFYGAKISLRNN